MSVSSDDLGRGRTVLVLTYRWPPQGGGGVQRTLKLVKYLSQLGWRPVVPHGVEPVLAGCGDPTLQAEVPPEATVYRTPTLEYESLRAAAGKVASSAIRAVRGKPTKAKSGGDFVRGAQGVAERRDGRGPGRGDVDAASPGGPRTGSGRGLLIPDPQIVWTAAAFASGLFIANREKPDVLYSSSPPNSLNVLALALAKRLRLPWIADFS